jgi:hypothetical protein
MIPEEQKNISNTEPLKLDFKGLVSSCCTAKVYPAGGRFKCMKCENRTDVKRVNKKDD